MSDEYIISLDTVSKEFRILGRKDATVLSRVAGIVSGKEIQRSIQGIKAVRDVNLHICKGEVVGIIGQNAAGKSTVLRLIAGILIPDKGTVKVRGPVTSLISLSAGLRNRLSVRDNIFLACSLFGMSRKEIRSAYEPIVDFAEIAEYADMYVYQLSNGMAQRLAFSIAIHTKPKILLLDEVFSAGDLSFEEKSKKKMTELILSDVTVVMVSHSLDRVEKLCDRVVWMHKGEVRKEGRPAEIIKEYTDFSMI